MRETWQILNPLAYAGLALVLSPVAAYFGGMWGWTVGAASLAILAIPTCLAALSGNRSAAVATTLISAVGCVLEAGFLVGHSQAESDWGFAMLSVGVLVGLSGTIIGVMEPLQIELHRLGQQSTDYLRDLYQRTREDSDHTSTSSIDSQNANAGSPIPINDGSVNYPMLLLTLQDMGRRIASNLDLDTLMPTIVSTAKSLLKCGECQLFLWNADSKSLRSVGPAVSRREFTYTPHPQRGAVRWVLENRQMVTRSDIERDYALKSLLEEDPKTPDAVAPLIVGGELIGLMILHGVEKDTAHFSRLLYILTNMSTLAIKNAQLFKRIEDMARRDGLTGLLNHASFEEALQEHVDEAQDGSLHLTVIMSDVDHFKKFNDTYGHQAGDHVLRETARLWRAVMPDYAIIARYGGEEFICALPGDDSARASELAELLRKQLESYPLDFEGQELRVTASLGVAEFHRPARNAEELVRFADEAMYRAKKSGRNRVCSALATPPTPNESTPAPTEARLTPVVPTAISLPTPS